MKIKIILASALFFFCTEMECLCCSEFFSFDFKLAKGLLQIEAAKQMSQYEFKPRLSLKAIRFVRNFKGSIQTSAFFSHINKIPLNAMTFCVKKKYLKSVKFI